MTPTPELEAAVERQPANPETIGLTAALFQGLRTAARERREFFPNRATSLTFFRGADFDEALRRAKEANALLTQPSLPTGDMASRDHAPGEQRQAETETLEEAIRLCEVGEYLYDARSFSAGDGYSEPREFSINWEWQQSKPGEYGQGILLAEATAWHRQQAEDGVETEAMKLRRISLGLAVTEGDSSRDAQSIPTGTGEGEAERLSRPSYVLSEPHLTGWRVIIGYETLSDAQAAHEVIASPSSTRSVK